MSILMALLHLMLTAATLGVLVGLFMLRRGVLQSFRTGEVSRMTELIHDVQLSLIDLRADVKKMDQNVRAEMDMLHRRLEHLEERDRGRSD